MVGEIDPSPESLAVEPNRAPLSGDEVYGPNPDGSARKGADLELGGEGFGVGAVNLDGSGSESRELDSPIDQKMEKVNLTGASHGTDSKEDGNGLLMVVDAVPVNPGVDGSEVFLSAESKVVDEVEDDATDSDEDGAETESEEPESDDDSSSEESSSSSSSEEDEDGDGHDSKEDEEDQEEVFIGSEGEGEGEGEGEEEPVKGAIKSKNELEGLPPVPQIEVTLEPHHQLLPVGIISSILATRVIVEGSVNHSPLNEGSILWITDTKSPLGLVDEIFGPVKCPYYVVRFNSDKDVPAGIGEGTVVSFVMEFANKILNEKDLYKKGYDASGDNDEEISDEVEFSDDEKEAEHKRSLSLEKRGIDDKSQGNRQNASRKKKSKFKGAEHRKGLRPLLPRGLVALNQLPPGVSGPLASLGANNSAYGGGSSSMGAGSACVSAPPIVPAVPQAMNSGGFPTTMPHQFLQQQPNAMWAHGMPPQQQPNAFWPYGMLPPLQQQQPNAIMGGFQMNGLPSQQLGNPVHQQQHQNQVSNGNLNVMPSQQQLLPVFGAPANMPWPFRPLNVYAGPTAPWPVGQVGVGQTPSGQGLPPPLQFNLGSSSVRGRKFSGQGDGHSSGRGGRRRKE